MAKTQGLAFGGTVLTALLTGPRLWHATRVSGQHLLSSEADVRLAFMERAMVERADVAITSTSWPSQRSPAAF